MKYLLISIIAVFSSPLLAQQFQAPVTDTQWQVVESPLECSLMQTIPGFGEAGFYRRNGGPLQLQFITDSQPAEQSNVAFKIADAPWQNNSELMALTSKPTERGQTRFVAEGKTAIEALSQLQDGKFPFISYRAQAYAQDIEVMLSTIRLNDSLPAFKTCLTNLYPDTFDEVRQLTVYFGLEQSKLDAESKKALARLAEYTKLDPSISQVQIDSHTDSHGRRRLNEPLSDARADAVRNFLVNQQDIPESMIRIRSYVDHEPAASNKTPMGRAHNRRAEITLIR
jgi:outer membrane protein OmpA-like peptidoglycan-associated protein